MADKYRIDRVIGTGGMGIVLAAHHVHLDETVAIKCLRPSATAVPQVVERFSREARAAVKIKNEHVVRVMDVGVLPTGSPYMVMEYLEGRDLAAWRLKHGLVSVSQAVDFVLQACEALAEAHRMGIVHRDLKPGNLFCVERADGTDSIKILDFGVSKVEMPAESGSSADLTRPATVLGTPLYMSPEQMLSSREVDARTDIWALGTILYELLAGQAPFRGETLAEVHARVASQSPPPMAKSRPDMPGELEAIILRCLEKDRGRRYANVAELAIALEPFAPPHALPCVIRTCRTLGNPPPAADLSIIESSDGRDAPTRAATAATWEHLRPRERRGPGRAVLLVAAMTASAALVAAAYRAFSDRPAPSIAAGGVASERLPSVAFTPPRTVLTPDRAGSTWTGDVTPRPTESGLPPTGSSARMSRRTRRARTAPGPPPGRDGGPDAASAPDPDRPVSADGSSPATQSSGRLDDHYLDRQY